MEINPLVERENFLKNLTEIIIETGEIARIFIEELGAGKYEIVVVVVVILDNILDILVTSAQWLSTKE